MESKIPFEKGANEYIKLYWLTEYLVKNKLREVDENMGERIAFIEKNQALPYQWVNSVVYEAKYPYYQLPKIHQWIRNVNLTIAKLLVGYSRFAKFYKLEAVVNELINKGKLNCGEKVVKELNEWNIPETLEDLISKYFYRRNEERDENEDE
uniref:Uncharacterized protein n=1 Tax=Meloidogyne enterolobii TaxID=390850 RepID=A0A6V7W0A2_MELEN|nr:unnamed protein product [Meloidogyne enterolobii]